MGLLDVQHLSVEVENKTILQDISFQLKESESYIFFGPNGSGKSTLIQTLIGVPKYRVMAGKIFFDNRDIIPLNIEERAKLGISVGFQTPPEISGVKLANLLKACVGKTVGEPFDEEETRLIEAFKVTDLLNRDVNVGFSGGERKRCEILQTIFLKPKLLLLDEPDSGVDVESLALIGNEIQRYVENSGSSALIVTHQGQILDYVKANYACVLLNGLAYCFKDPKKIYENIRSVGYERCVMCTNRGIEERVC